MISMAADGLTRRRGARLDEQTQQGTNDKARRQQPVVPMPPLVLALSGAILVGASLFIVWYHVVHDQQDE
jgi:hypothetical protein